jgi:NAD-dependent deacetylase
VNGDLTAEERVQALRNLIEKSNRIVVLSGAGMSTESGIPDFRSGGGFWEDEELVEAMSVEFLHQYPERFWPKFKQVFLKPEFLQALPNAGHRALAALESSMAKSVSVFTQNVDGLHSKAGSKRVYELHGNVGKAACPVCHTEYGLSHILAADVPRCNWVSPKGNECDAILHPDTVLFGGEVRFYREAALHFASCDLALVLGTSLTVEPAASLPRYVRSGTGKLVIINLEPTECDALADLVIHAKVGETLARVIGGRDEP